jgi:hypothetical protein
MIYDQYVNITIRFVELNGLRIRFYTSKYIEDQQ